MRDNQTFVIDNPKILGNLCGPNDSNLKELSLLLATPVRARGNRIMIAGADNSTVLRFRNMLDWLMDIANNGYVSVQHIRSIMATIDKGEGNHSVSDKLVYIDITGHSRRIYPKNQTQSDYINCMRSKDIVFSVGPAGTGKTWLAIAHGLMRLLSGKIRKIILTRPVVEAGESLGFLPGDLTQKLAPYLRPLYDAMEDLIKHQFLEQLRANGQLEVAPLAYMRGRSLNDCYIVVDEAQNTTVQQMKMLLTRLSSGSQAIITGDITQIDLPGNMVSGLVDALEIFNEMEEIAIIRFGNTDVVRHPLVRKIVEAYEKLK